MDALLCIEKLENGDLSILRTTPWLRYLYLTQEARVNLERIESMSLLSNQYLLRYVKQTLLILSECKDLDIEDLQLIETVLCWSEVAKGGMPHHRKIWQAEGINLFSHNLGSADIYMKHQIGSPAKHQLTYTLIATHGLTGQYLRGEVPFNAHQPLMTLLANQLVTPQKLNRLLLVLNECIIRAVSDTLWQRVQKYCAQVIESIVKPIEPQPNEESLQTRLERLRFQSIQNGESFEHCYTRLQEYPAVVGFLEQMLSTAELWYVEAALYDFDFSIFIKILLLATVYHQQIEASESSSISEAYTLSFEPLMLGLYYEHNGKKSINIYKKRIIEKLLTHFSYEQLLEGQLPQSTHTRVSIIRQQIAPDKSPIYTFDFQFSPAGDKLIEFCVAAEASDLLYERAIVMLFDLFELRRDAYDRFHNEDVYLTAMNAAIDHKKTLLDYISGDSVLDIGPGGGALLDLMSTHFPNKSVAGVDISQNVIEALEKRKQLEGRRWDILYSDAMDLEPVVNARSADTIVFCSVLHELYSYIPTEGQKFNHKTLANVLKSAFQALPQGGRIIIRDGIMTEPESLIRELQFTSESGMQFLMNYVRDFQGRSIQYTTVGHNKVQMPINDAMEFLYTYTWGDASYAHEINEQFGYFTPTAFRHFIRDVLGTTAQIIEFKHFLQVGYATALEPKVILYDLEGNKVPLPDSTCIIVIQKA